MIIDENFYTKDTVEAARELLGTFLVHDSPAGRTMGRIVETEAYLFEGDPACHAHKGKTKRNAVMFGPPGHGYIYLIYGIYCCFNVVTAPEGTGEAVLIRALEPVEGITLMEKRRGTKDLKNLCSGPGKLVMAMGLTREQNGCDLINGPVRILGRNSCPDRFHDYGQPEIFTTTRIGISEGIDLPFRFYLAGNKFISKK